MPRVISHLHFCHVPFIKGSRKNRSDLFPAFYLYLYNPDDGLVEIVDVLDESRW